MKECFIESNFYFDIIIKLYYNIHIGGVKGTQDGYTSKLICHHAIARYEVSFLKHKEEVLKWKSNRYRYYHADI